VRPLGPKPAEAAYGYLVEHAYASSREELVARVADGRPTPLVWTPETEGIVPYWTVPWLFAAYRSRGIRHSRKVALLWLAVCVGCESFAVATGHFSFFSVPVLVGWVAGIIGFYSALEWGRYGRLTPEKLALKVREARSRPPPRQGPARYTQAVAGALAAVVLVQSLMAVVLHHGMPIAPGRSSNLSSVDAAAMVKAAVHAGAWWRLVTGAFLHDGLLHFGLNVMALLALGRFLEAFAHRAYVPTVFFLTALVASLASYRLSGADASLGASGGIMGLFGFLAVMAHRRRALMPAGFGTAIMIDIAVIAAMGIFGAGYVDNWAHLGGFLSGAGLGWLMIPHSGRTAYWEPSRPIRRIGDVALGLIALSALGTIVVLGLRFFAELS
jgi:rhomboid protease GluP